MDESRLENQMIEEAKAQLATNKVETPQPEAAPQPEPVIEDKPSPQDSWKYMREELERAREIAERERKEKEYLLKQFNERSNQPEPEIEDPRFAEEAYIEGKDLTKQQEATNLKLKREREAREASEKRMYDMIVENRLLQEHPDMHSILADANLKKLKELKPDLVKSIISNPDTYSMHKATIDAVKAFVLTDKDETRKLEKQNERMNSNLSKPIPSTSSASPLTQATAFADKNLTTEDKSEIYKNWAKKHHGSYYNFKK